MSPGSAIGSVMLKKVRSGPAPTSRAASSRFRLMPRNVPVGIQIMNSSVLISWIMTTPANVSIRFNR